MNDNHFTAHPGFYNLSIRLSPEEQAQPLEVLREFFQSCHLSEVRQTLWQAIEAAFAADYSIYDEAEQRSHLLWFYCQLERSLEAGLLLCKEGVYKKAKPVIQPDQLPLPIWPSKADLEDEIRDLKIENKLQESELIELRFFKKHGRPMIERDENNQVITTKE